MQCRFQYHSQFINGRKIVVWGTGQDARALTYELSSLGVEIEFYVSKDYEKKSVFFGKPIKEKSVLVCEKFYVLIATRLYHEQIKEEIKAFGFKEKFDFYDWYAAYVPYDYDYNGVTIGKNSHFPLGWYYCFDRFKSIGRFTSVNGSVQLSYGHRTDRLTTGNLRYAINDNILDICDAKYGIEHRNKVVVGNDVWVGANVFINGSKVKLIGNGAIIGSGAVVLEDVPPYAIVVGVPAKIKKYRFTPEQIEILEKVKWWDWSDEMLNDKAECLYNPGLFFKEFSR